MTPRDSDVCIRWIATDRIPAAQFPEIARHLSPEERARAERFRFIADQQTYIAAHGLLRGMLAGLTGQAADSWTFDIGPKGKPHPVRLPGAPDIRANLSHTRGLAVVGVTLGREIGVDVESLARPAPLEIAARYFSPRECALIESAPGSKHETFFALWTQKEAYMKATGHGMALPLDSFAVTLDPPALDYCRDDPEPARWQLGRAKLDTTHMLSWVVACPADTRHTCQIALADADDLSRGHIP